MGSDWDAEARRAATHLGERCHKAHRGVVAWQTHGVFAVFGNDAYGSDPRARREVEVVREGLAAAGAVELGFGVADDGEDYSWALIVQGGDVETLDSLVWDAWDAACGATGERDGYRLAQQAISHTAVFDAGCEPTVSMN